MVSIIDVQQSFLDWLDYNGCQYRIIKNNGTSITIECDLSTAIFKASEATPTEGIGGGIPLEVVTSLPQEGKKNIIYLVPGSSGKTSNLYDEYIWTDDGWELFGSASLNLDQYATKVLLSQELAKKQDTINDSNKLSTNYLDDSASDQKLVSPSEKTTWNGKQNQLSQEQLTAVNSGIDSTKVSQIATNKSDIANIKDGTTIDSFADVEGELANKQNNLSTTQLNAVNSGVTQEKVSNYDNHLSNTNNPHSVTKSQVGLSNVDNTSDLDKPISTAQQTALDGMVTLGTAQTITAQKTFRSKVSFESSEAGNPIDINPRTGEVGSFISGSMYLTAGGTSFSAPLNGQAGSPAVTFNNYVTIKAGTDNTIDLGLSNQRWKNLYLSDNLSDGTNSISIANIANKNEVVKNATIAIEYSSSSTYAVGDKVMYQGLLYVCSTAISTAEEWDSTHWIQKSIIEMLSEELATKLDKENPTGVGSFSLNRKPNTTIGVCSVAEGNGTTASNDASHAEGNETTASGYFTHAEGGYTTASGAFSHAEGNATTASGGVSHAEGYGTTASGELAHAEGNETVAQRKSQHVFGEYNIVDATGTTTTRGNYVEIVGNGTSSNARSNARTLDWSGNEVLAGGLTIGANATLSDGTNSITIANIASKSNVTTLYRHTVSKAPGGPIFEYVNNSSSALIGNAYIGGIPATLNMLSLHMTYIYSNDTRAEEYPPIIRIHYDSSSSEMKATIINDSGQLETFKLYSRNDMVYEDIRKL